MEDGQRLSSDWWFVTMHCVTDEVVVRNKSALVSILAIH